MAGAAAIVLACLHAIPSPAAPACASTSERLALQTRVVQTDLMVASLSCNERDGYNRFVTRFQPQLVAQGKTLQRFFRLSYGTQGVPKMNAFITQLANESSSRSLQNIEQFCGEARARLAEALILPANEFTTFVARQPMADAHGIPPCTN